MLLPVSWLSIYSYVIAYIGGEVKSPRKNLFIAQIINQIVPLGIVVFLCVAYSRAVGWNGMHAIAWISNNNLNGFNLPFKPTYVDIASMVIGHSKIIGFIMAMAFIMADWLYVPSSYICWSRASFAWGMDNFGPKWFTELNSRTGQPIWPLLLMFVASEIAIAQYSWHPNFLGGFSVEVLEMITVFGISAISAIMLPYVGKVRFIWKTSPYHDWKIAGIPVVSISGVLLLIMVVLLVYSYYTASALQFLYSVWTWIFVGVWAIGVGWYYWWKWVKAKEGIDVTLAFTELPPE
jgi:amino acid transporter